MTIPKMCKRCSTGEAAEWVKCCEKHTPNYEPSVMCLSCALALHPEGIFNERTVN